MRATTMLNYKERRRFLWILFLTGLLLLALAVMMSATTLTDVARLRCLNMFVREPLDGVVPPSLIAPAITTLCRNTTTDPGWPAQQSCVVPAVNTEFTTRTLPTP